MVKQYQRSTNEQRRELIRLIKEEKMSIIKASKIVGLPYANAKSINSTYMS